MSQFIEMFGDCESNTHNYPIKKVGDFAECFAGATPSTKVSAYWDNGNIPWMSSGEVHKGRVKDTDAKISQQGYDGCSTKMVPVHSVVIALAGQGKTRGTVAINDIELCTNQSLCAIVPNEEVNYEYLYHNLRGRYKELRSMSGDVDGRGGLNLKHIQSIKNVVPPMEEQLKFVSIAQQADKSGFDGLKSQFIEMFGNPVTNSKKWPTKPIIEVAPERPSETQTTGLVWLLNLDMIESNTGKVIEKVYEDDSNLLSVAPFDEGNVLYSKLRPYLNKVVIPDGKGYATTELVPLRPKQELLNLSFLSHLLRSDDFVAYANGIATGTKMPRMPLNDLRKFNCILPPIEMQMEFEEIAHQADKSGSVLLKLSSPLTK